MTPDDQRHGTEAGNEQHRRDREDPCEPCYNAKLVAARRRSKRKAMGHRYTVDAAPARARLLQWRAAGATYNDIENHTGIASGRLWEIVNDGAPVIYTRTAVTVLRANGFPVTSVGLTRRIQALMWLGWAAERIASEAGVHKDTILNARHEPRQFWLTSTQAGVLAAYERLSMTVPTGATKQQRAGITRARNLARRNSWLPPLAWDQIDDAREHPTEQARRAAA